MDETPLDTMNIIKRLVNDFKRFVVDLKSLSNLVSRKYKGSSSNSVVNIALIEHRLSDLRLNSGHKFCLHFKAASPTAFFLIFTGQKSGQNAPIHWTFINYLLDKSTKFTER